MGIVKLSKTLSAFFFASGCLFAADTEIGNEKIKIAFDGNENLISLRNLVSEREYAGGGGIWRIIYQDGLLLEEVVESGNVPAKVEKLGDCKLRIVYGGEFPVKIDCEVVGDEIRFVPEISNKSKNKVLREFQFPVIGNAKLEKDSKLVLSHYAGMEFRDIPNWIRGAHSQYIAQDNKAIERGFLYPGRTSCNFYVLDDGRCGLYVGSHDSSFTQTMHLFRLRKDGSGYKPVDLAMAKYPFLNAGESKKYPEYVVSPHAGDWHIGAKKYRKWADSWFDCKPAPKSFAESNGWQRLIMRHQYGTVIFPYSELPKLADIGNSAGIDTILMFGWTLEGHDSGYPNYSPDTTQGGDEALKKYISEAQKRGGKVVVYFNGQLMDMSTDFYKKVGHKLCVKNQNGTPFVERYPFGGDGTSMRAFCSKTFAIACPTSRVWIDEMKRKIDRVVEMGADGVFFDQLGFVEICWDSSHGHRVPSMELMADKVAMVKELRDYAKSKNPQMSFGIEVTSDATFQHVDFVHSVWVNTDIAYTDKFGVPRTRFSPVVKYTFPEVNTSDREIRDDNDTERRLNLAVLRGWRSDVEIYRCRATIDDAPRYKAHMGKINRLRAKYHSLIVEGRFCDTDFARASTPKVSYSVFTRGDELAVAATQSHLASLDATFTVEGYSYVGGDSASGAKVCGSGGRASVSLPKNELAVMVFRRADGK